MSFFYAKSRTCSFIEINLNITQKHYNISKPASIPQSPHDKPQKTHPTHIQRSADAPPPPGTSQGNSAPAAIQRSADGPPPSRQTTTPHTPKNQNGQSAPLADCPFVPPFIPQKKSPQAQTPRNSPKTKQHHLLRSFRSFLSSLSSRSARAFSLNVFTLSSLRPCSIP